MTAMCSFCSSLRVSVSWASAMPKPRRLRNGLFAIEHQRCVGESMMIVQGSCCLECYHTCINTTSLQIHQ